MGLSEIRKKAIIRKIKKSKKMEEMVKELDDIIRTLSNLNKKISEFEKKWGSDQEFLELTRQEILREIMALRQIYRGSFLDKLTGRYYDYLAFEILKLPTHFKKPILSFPEIMLYLTEKLGKISKSDVEKTIEILRKRKLIMDVFNVGNITYVEFLEIYNDIKTVLDYLNENKKEEVTIEDLAVALDWEVTRAERVLEKMAMLGLMAKEDYPRRYWLIR